MRERGAYAPPNLFNAPAISLLNRSSNPSRGVEEAMPGLPFSLDKGDKFRMSGEKPSSSSFSESNPLASSFFFSSSSFSTSSIFLLAVYVLRERIYLLI
jgi:hypothetical protein